MSSTAPSDWFSISDPPCSSPTSNNLIKARQSLDDYGACAWAFTGTTWTERIGVPVATTYEDPRSHGGRERYLALFGGEGLPVPVEAIVEELLSLRDGKRGRFVSVMPAPYRAMPTVSHAEHL